MPLHSVPIYSHDIQNKPRIITESGLPPKTRANTVPPAESIWFIRKQELYFLNMYPGLNKANIIHYNAEVGIFNVSI